LRYDISFSRGPQYNSMVFMVSLKRNPEKKKLLLYIIKTDDTTESHTINPKLPVHKTWPLYVYKRVVIRIDKTSSGLLK